MRWKGSLCVLVAAALVLLVSAPVASAVSYDRPQATVYTIDVDEDGDATWTIELRYQLVGDEEVEAFESIQKDFEEGNLSVFEGIEGDMEPFAEEASQATGRPMSLSGFEKDVYIRDTLTQRVGIVSVTFEWNGFANVTTSSSSSSPSEVRVGDAFVGSGLALTENERLVIELMDDPPLESASPKPDTNDGDRLVWDGERFFEEGQPTVVFSGTTDGGGSENGNGENGTGSPSPSPPSDSGDGSFTVMTAVAGFLLLVSGFAGGLYLGRKTGLISTKRQDEEGEEYGDEEAEVGTELLTDEDRVVQILEENGGKMKQAEIVEQTDWSKSKVSMLLSNMEEDERISKLRLGRENVIELEDG